MRNTESKDTIEREVEARRLAAIPMLKTGVPHQQIADRFGVSRRTVRSWSTRYRRGGEDALHVSRPFHRPSRLTEEQKQQLVELLLRGAREAGFETDLWTCPRIGQLVERQFGVHYHVDYLPDLLRRLGFSPQKPESEAAERDPQRIARWVHKEWRKIKKKPAEPERE